MLYPQINQYRNLYCMDGFWDFYADYSEKSSDCIPMRGLSETRPIAVPASWNEQYEDLFQFHGKGWYTKQFFVPEQWKQQDVYIRFGSVSGKARVWINGQYVAEHIGTALPFEAGITSYIKFGEKNTVVVLADSTLDPWALPPATLMENEGRMGFAQSYPAVPYDFFSVRGNTKKCLFIYFTQNENRGHYSYFKNHRKRSGGFVCGGE